MQVVSILEVTTKLGLRLFHESEVMGAGELSCCDDDEPDADVWIGFFCKEKTVTNDQSGDRRRGDGRPEHSKRRVAR